MSVHEPACYPVCVHTKSRLDTTFAVELLVLLAAAPMLYFPARLPPWAPAVGFLFLAAGWLYRRRRLGIWYVFTPADLPILFLLVVMLPISIWAAPAPLRMQFSIPRTYILLWSLCVFATVGCYGSLSRNGAEWAIGGFVLSTLLIALAAPLGVAWLYKLPGLRAAVTAIPSPLIGVFSGAEAGFHPNQVAGTLLYAFPLMLAITAVDIIRRRRTLESLTVSWLIWLSTPLVIGVLILTQSRSALLALAAAILVMVLVNARWGRWILLLGAAALLVGLSFAPPTLVDAIGGSPPVQTLGGTSTLGFRQDVWTQAISALHDFPFTGMGFGTFRKILFLLYPTSISPDYNVGHAHNFFLQVGLDFGLPGLIAIIAVHIVALVQIAAMWRASGSNSQSAGIRILAIGLLGSMVAHLAYSQLDAIAMGAKINFMLWYYLALVFALGNLVTRRVDPKHAVRRK